MYSFRQETSSRPTEYNTPQSSAPESGHKAENLHKYEEENPLMNAVMDNDIDAVREIILSCANINFQDKDGYTPLMRAIRRGNSEIAKLLIRSGADVNAETPYGSTALMDAICFGSNTEIAKLLIDRGANIYVKDMLGKTLLDLTQIFHGPAIADLIKAKMDSDLHSNKPMGSDLIMAILNNNIDFVHSSILSGVNVNAKDNAGNTALKLASERGQTEIVKLLLDAGADINIGNTNDYTPLEMAILNGHSMI